MTKQTDLRALSDLRDTLHGPRAPDWMRGVLATGVGPKLVAGRQTDSPAIHFVVPRKLPLSELPPSAHIPQSFAGHATDVIDGSGDSQALSDVPALPSPSGYGYGMPLLTEGGEWGTAACAGTTAQGRSVLVTSAHVVQLDEAVYDGASDPPVRLGRCSGRLPSASRSELYGQRGSAAEGQHLVDVAVIELDPQVPALGSQTPFGSSIPSGTPWGLRDLDRASIDQWLFSSTPLCAWGAASQVWRRGSVVFYWPRRTEDNLYGLCLVQQDPLSEPGDSGSLWLAYLGGRFQALGLHWGLSTDRRSVMAFVTDGLTGLQQLGVPRIMP